MARRPHIRRIAQQILTEAGVAGPPVDVQAIARRLDARVHRVADEAEDVSGFLLRDPVGDITLIGVNARHHRWRQRFTVAHELGHLCLHQTERLHVDGKRGYSVVRRSTASSLGADPKEIEANVFAAELLMPVDFLEEDVSSDRFASLSGRELVKELARRYQVSQAAMRFRLSNLGLIVIEG